MYILEKSQVDQFCSQNIVSAVVNLSDVREVLLQSRSLAGDRSKAVLKKK